MASAEHCDPSAMSACEEHEATWRVVVPAPRKRVASTDVVGGWAVKRTWSPRPLAVSPVPSSPTTDMAERAGRSEEWSGVCAATGPMPTPNLQPEEAPPVVGAVEKSGQSEGQTGA